MLTLRAPIQLNTMDSIQTVPDAFNQKLLANYELLSQHVRPEDLLFLVTSPPELPEDLGGGTSFSMSSSFVSSQQVTLDVVNNVVNRILLSDRADFTYQDSVYVTSVLQKLGITNVSEFIRQVDQLRQENVNVRQLLRLYSSNLDLLMTELHSPEGRRERAAAPEAPGETAPAEGARYFLHDDIYHRLATREIYDTVRNFCIDRTRTESYVSNRELRTAEQCRVGENLALSELKNQTIFRDSVSLLHHINHYELGDILPPPRTEQEALAEGAAAVLLSTVDNVMVTRMEQVLSRRDFWLDLTDAIYQTAENSLARFESYHSSADIRELHQEVSYSQQLSELYQSETDILNRLLTELHREGDTVHVDAGAARTELERLTLEHRQTETYLDETETTQEGDAVTKVLPKEVVLETTRELLERQIFPPPGQRVIPPPPGEAPPPGMSERVELTHLERGRLSERETRETAQRTDREQTAETLRERESTREFQDMISNTLLSRETRETLQKNFFLQPEEHRHLTEARSGDIVYDHSSQNLYETTQEVSQTAVTAAEQTQLLKRRLDEINRRNVEVYERFQREQREHIREQAPAPDRKRAQMDALRAIDEPEKVLTEMLQAPAPMEHRPLSPALETILSQTDETTRQVYETILQYQTDPEGAADGLLRRASVGGFNAEAAAVQRQEVLALQHPDQVRELEQRVTRETTENVIERFREAPQSAAAQRAADWSRAPKPAIVHRQLESQISEEFLEQLEERRTQSEKQIVTNETVTTQSISQTEINALKQEVVSRSTEDITEIINRAMARQIGSITDRVYSQMERRLETERARRGRF